MRAAVLTLTLAGCGLFDTPDSLRKSPPPAVEGRVTADAESLQRAQGAVVALRDTLKARLQGAMAEGGPVAAVQVCADEAQAMTRQVGEAHDVQVGRASLRARNPADQGPLWVRSWLHEQGERPAEGVAGVDEVVETPEGRVARVLRPIPLEAPCVACHGDPAQIAPEVRAILAERYPGDAATGYAPGDLRGVTWAEARVHAP